MTICSVSGPQPSNELLLQNPPYSTKYLPRGTHARVCAVTILMSKRYLVELGLL